MGSTTDDMGDMNDRQAYTPSLLAAQVGQTIARLRKAAGLTQRQLAERAGITNQAHISKIETGYHEPQPETLRKIAAALGIDVRDLGWQDEHAADCDPNALAVVDIITSEGPIGVHEAARLLGPARGGDAPHPHVETVRGYILHGSRGVRLEAFHGPSGWVTSPAAIRRFLARIHAQEGRG